MVNGGIQSLRAWAALVILAGCGLASSASPLRARPSPGPNGPNAPAPGQISGTISFRGTRPEMHPINMAKDPVCVSEQNGPVMPQDGRVNANGTLPDAFVYIKPAAGMPSFAAPRAPVALTQQGCMYQPHVLGIMVGQPLEVITLDPTTHNIHVMPKVNREWNVTQQPGSPSILRTFAHPEVMIPVHCNVHPWMRAYIAVVDNPFYAVSGSDGSFIIKGVPPGEYTLAVWTAAFGTQEQRVVVRPGESTVTSFTVEKQ
ncbi:MAG TPA: carboxypeptidase regulatory-like domain-containing protein [Candidatus Acidoferrales bacterium]|nr:carboxypeptidase regulatory-like domain-containing protein [Candidatus Acidoferrales bacterium]